MVPPPVSSLIRDAATVLPLRDGDAGLEVFMVRRHLALDFLGGAHVFPGGAVDSEDQEPGYDPYLCGFDFDFAAKRLEETDTGRVRGFYVAALRELFEEAGVLLASARRNEPGAAEPAAVRDVFGPHREALVRGQRGFFDIVREQHVLLACDSLCYLGHWITPPTSPKRFDTRFFLARLPEGQSAAHDRTETTAGEWLRPEYALSSYGRGEIRLVTPTICALDWLRLHADVDTAIAATRELPIVDVRPAITIDDARVTIHYLDGGSEQGTDSAGVEPGRMLARAVQRQGVWIQP
jgi:8-oxo-dGTP pyrophosphatase MutT (NUDIX family)